MVLKITKDRISLSDSANSIVKFTSAEKLMKNIVESGQEYNRSRLCEIIESIDKGLEELNGDKERLVKYLWNGNSDELTGREVRELGLIICELDDKDYTLDTILYAIQECIVLSGVYSKELEKLALGCIEYTEDKKEVKAFNREYLRDGFILKNYNFLLTSDEIKQASEEMKEYRELLKCPTYVKLLVKIIDLAYAIWRGDI